jgi:hypothetical protein
MEAGVIIALIIGIFIILFPVALIWYLNIGGILISIRNRGVARQFKEVPSYQTCSIDNDCPPGYKCLGGRCIPME